MVKKRAVLKEDKGNDEKSIAYAKIINLPWPKILLFIALIATIIGALYSTKTLKDVEKKIANAKEMARPANIKLVKITTPNCAGCFNLENAIFDFKKQNVKIDNERSVSFNSKEGQSLTKNLRIKRLPTYILTGEIEKKSFEVFVKSNGTIQNNTFVFNQVKPVFIEPANGKEQGKVTVTYLLDSSCTQCLDPKYTVDALKKAGVQVADQKELTWNSREGQNLITQYKITKVPTFILSPEISVYADITASINKLGTFESNRTFIARNVYLPYRDLDKGQILGLVDLIYLTDSSCPDCYKSEEVHKTILTRGFGMGMQSERTVDRNSAEGQNIIAQYKITQVPTVLLSPEADQYVNLKSQWPSVGTVEADGWYIFRQLNRLGPVVYNDLIKNQIINRVSPAPSGAVQRPTDK